MASKRLIFAAGAGVAVVTFQGAFLSGCGVTNACTVRQSDGTYKNVCVEEDAGADADDARASDASTDAGDAASDAATDAAADSGDSGDAADDAPSDAPDQG